MCVGIRNTKYCVLYVYDVVTAYSESSITSRRSAECMASLFKVVRIHHHGMPNIFPADSDFTRGILKQFISSHDILQNIEGVTQQYKKPLFPGIIQNTIGPR